MYSTVHNKLQVIVFYVWAVGYVLLSHSVNVVSYLGNIIYAEQVKSDEELDRIVGSPFLTIAYAPSVWGPALWRVLTYLFLRYPMQPTDEQKQRMQECVKMILSKELIGCDDCMNHLTFYINSHPIPFDNRITLIKWLLALHNRVNQRKQTKPWTYAEFVTHYIDYPSGIQDKNKWVLWNVIALKRIMIVCFGIVMAKLLFLLT